MSSATTAIISPALRGDSGAAAAATAAGAAGAGPIAAAARATLGAGVGVGCAGAAGRGGGAVAVEPAGAAVHAGEDAVPSTIPQWTQNFAPGWFSLPHAGHFIDDSSPGTLDSAPTRALRMKMRAALHRPSEAYYDPIIVRLSLYCDAKRSRCSPPPPLLSSSLQPPLDATIEYAHRARLDAMADSR
jgi:hypothetical protein